MRSHLLFRGHVLGTTYDRFWGLVDRSGGTEACWPWRGLTNRDGIGVFKIRGRRTTARRYAYRMQWGDPGHLRVTVTCGQAGCVNWRHLQVREARAVATSNGSAAALNAARLACPAGHEHTEANLYRRPGQRRAECQVCKVARRPGPPPVKRVSSVTDRRVSDPAATQAPRSAPDGY